MLRLATTLVRAWTRFYTWGLPDDARDARRAEIESDLWEFSRDLRDEGLGTVRAAWTIAARLVAGFADDFAWRLEQGGNMSPVRTSIWLLVGALVVALLWPVINVMRAQRLPVPPNPPHVEVGAPPPVRLPPPPPPPPPPPR